MLCKVKLTDNIISNLQMYYATLNSSTTDELGSWGLKGLLSWAASRYEEGGIHGNPASRYHQRHRHTEPSQWNTYQREGGEGKKA